MFKFLYSNFYDQLSKINTKSSSASTEELAKSKPKPVETVVVAVAPPPLPPTPPQPDLVVEAPASSDTALSSLSHLEEMLTSSLKSQPDEEAPSKPSYSRAYSFSSPSTHPSNYLNLSTPNYFSKGFSPKTPPKQALSAALSGPAKSNLTRANTLSPKSLSRKSSLQSGPKNLTKLNENTNIIANTFLTNPNVNSEYSCLFNNTFQSLVHYGDNIGAKVVKCLINENLYETQSLINQDYDIYQVKVFFFFFFFFTFDKI